MSNPKIVNFWPRDADHPTPPDISRWVVIYPAYIDKGRSIANGRKISRELAVSSPNAWQMFEVCSNHLGLPVALQDKAYSKSWWDRAFVRTPKALLRAGCIRVKIRDEEGNPLQDKDGNVVSSRGTLYKLVAKIVPTVQSDLEAARTKFVENNQTEKEKKKNEKKAKKKKKKKKKK